jgi:hypothetical protein
MKGKILGFDAAAGTGAISGEEGRRYKFHSAEWKGQRPPKAGEEVDFEIADDGHALEIYPLRAGAALDFSEMGAKVKDALGTGGAALSQAGADGAASPTGERAVALVKGRLSVPLALALLFASLALTFIGWSGQIPMMPMARSDGASIIGIADYTASVDRFFGALDRQVKADIRANSETPGGFGMFGGISMQQQQRMLAQRNQSQTAHDDIELLGMAMKALYLAYLIPLGAAFLLYREWVDAPTRLLSLGVGLVCLFEFAVVLFVGFGTSTVIEEAVGKDGMAMLASATGGDIGAETGLGTYVVLLCGIGLILNALGIVGRRRVSGTATQPA